MLALYLACMALGVVSTKAIGESGQLQVSEGPARNEQEEHQGKFEVIELPAPGGDPCCPAGHGCLEQPFVTFSRPTNGQQLRVGEPVEVGVYACYMGSNYTTSVRVECPGFQSAYGDRSFSFVPPQSGICSLTASAGDYPLERAQKSAAPESRIPASARISIEIFGGPKVSLTAPIADSAPFPVGASIALAANASDADGSIDRVVFEVRGGRGQLVFSETDRTPPYAASMPNAAAGTYTVTASAFDNEGQDATDSRSFAVVADNVAPTVTITAPSASSFIAPANIAFEAAASDPDGSITQVAFELRNAATNAVLLSGTDSLPPYTISATSLAAGNYVMHARATDNRGASSAATKTLSVIANQPPVVAMQSPAANHLHVLPGSLELRATASDSDGTIQSVEFRHGAGGSTLIGAASPVAGGAYAFNWSGMAPGDYQIIARVRDNVGAAVDTPVRNVRVRNESAPNAVPGDSERRPYAHSNFNHLAPNFDESFKRNVFTPGQKMDLQARFTDDSQDIERIEFFLLAADAPSSSARSLAVVNFVVPNSTPAYRASTSVSVTESMVSQRMQRVYAVATDRRGKKAGSEPVPVAIRSRSDIATACHAQWPGSCDRSFNAFHSIPGAFMAAWYDRRPGSTMGVAGESYFDTHFLTQTSGGSASARGDDVSMRCEAGQAWHWSQSPCSLTHRETGTFQSWRLRFHQRGAYQLLTCHGSEPQRLEGPLLEGSPENVTRPLISLEFNGGTLGPEAGLKAIGRLEEVSGLSRFSEQLASQGVSLPASCPGRLFYTNLETGDGTGELIEFPADWDTTMTFYAGRPDGSGRKVEDLVWLALVPVLNHESFRFNLTQPTVDQRVALPQQGSLPQVNISATLVKSLPGGTVRFHYRPRSSAGLPGEGTLCRVGSGEGCLAEWSANEPLTARLDFEQAFGARDNVPPVIEVWAKLDINGETYTTPSRRIITNESQINQVEWINPSTNSPSILVYPAGQRIELRARAKWSGPNSGGRFNFTAGSAISGNGALYDTYADPDQSSCPGSADGWVCYLAFYTVNPRHLSEIRFGGVASSADGRINGLLPDKVIRSNAIGGSPVFEVESPAASQVYLPSEQHTVRAEVVLPASAGALSSVGFQSCEVSSAQQQCDFSSLYSSGALQRSANGKWVGVAPGVSLASGQNSRFLRYRLSATVVPPGSPPITFYSDSVLAVTSSLPANQIPVVSWQSPVEGETLAPSRAVSLVAEVVDPEGQVSRVDFLGQRNGQTEWVLEASRESAGSKRWSASWLPAIEGQWTLIARAVDGHATNPLMGTASRSVRVGQDAGPSLPHEAPDPVPTGVASASDGVGATAGTFRVDETGSATYSIPLAVVPGRAGVAPEMALAYSSQGGMGVMGRGWSISGASAITRCRQTAEAGDQAALQSGSPPLSFGESDRYCLDGQRLMLVAGSYAPNAPSMEFRTEIDSFARIRAFNTDGVNGPNYFVVQAKDGTTSWYGDSINRQGLPFMPSNFAAVPRSDAALRRNDGSGQLPAADAPVLSFALARRMDSFGNFVDYKYETDQIEGQQLLSWVEYTGKVQLNGQAGGAQPAFAALRFNYENLHVTQQRAGWQAGMRVRSTKRLASVDSLASISAGQVIRQYRLAYGITLPISGESVLSELRECSSASADAVCYQPTRFGWDRGTLAMDQLFNPNLVNHTRKDVKGHQLGDIDGDGLMDLVWFDNRSATPGHCPAGLPWETQRIWTGFGTVKESAGQQQFDLEVGTQRHACSLRSYGDLPGAWFLQDYNADGRDDLWLADKPPASGQVNSWQIYPSNGRSTTAQVFNQSTGLLTTCPQNDPDAANCLPVNRGNNLLVQLADVNGDGLLDAVYGSPDSQVSSPEGNIIRIKLMERSGSGYAFSRAYSVRLDFDGQLADCATAGQGPGPLPGQSWLRECRVRFEDPSSRWGRAPNPIDLNGDGRGDLLLLVEKIYEELCPITTPNCWIPRPIEAGEQASSFWIPSSEKQLEALVENAQAPSRSSQVAESTRSYHLAAVVESVDATNRRIQLAPYHQWDSGLQEPNGAPFRDRFDASPADLNGDGLMDLIWSASREDEINIDLNTGDGFIPLQTVTGIHGRDYLRVLDFDADGRADLVYPSGSGRGSFWQMRRGLADGGVSTSATNLPLFMDAGDPNSRLGLNPQRGAFFFADLDGDGRTDYLDIPTDPDGERYARLLRTSVNGFQGAGRFKPLAQINTITNGYGAVTEITYQPLTNGAVYLREPGSRAQSASVGNGSPVQDLLGGMYVVSRVASDAPGLGNPNRKSELLYQYRGARMQAGGRGMLGFREVRTIDANFDPGAGGALSHIVSITEYGLAADDPETGVARYGFPYIGMPRESRQYRVSGAVPSSLRNCLLSGPEQTSGYCFDASGLAGNPNAFFNEPSGTLLSYARNRLAHAVTVTGIAGERSVFPYIQASFEAKGNPESTGVASLSETVNLFNYQADWGDLANSEVSTASGASYSGLAALRDEALARVAAQTTDARCPSARCVTRVSTVNAWLPISQPTAENDRDYWRLGRLDKSTVTHWRQGAHAEPASSLTRESRFEYDMDSVTRTGALTVERVAGLLNASSATALDGSASELKTIRLRDAYGNVTDTFVCSGDVSTADCKDPNKVKQRTAGVNDAPLMRVHRYSRTEYDAQGRYPIRTLAPYFKEAEPAGVLHALEEVSNRDLLGNVLQTNRLNGGSATATYGPLGRQQISEDSTGAKTVSEYHWCAGGSATGQVAACPSDIGAVFRQTAYAYGGTRSVTYFDRLGREVFALSESFNRYDENAGNNWVGVCKTYDGRGRTVAVTEPFFVGNVATSGLRPELSTAVGCASKASTRTTYDVLDRAVTIHLPEDVGGSTVARTEMEYQGLSTTTRTHLSRATSPFAAPTTVTLSEVKLHDATGLVLTVTDAEGLEAKYAHDAAGNLIALKRDAGNGEIVSRIGYDALGRKISQNDPDAGTASYAYNAAGELICSQDARGYATITDFDALGRSWRTRSQSNGCPAPTPEADVPTTEAASALTGQFPGTHASVDVTVYDLAANGMGQVASSVRRHRVGSTYGGYRGAADDQGEFQQTTTYDSFGRPSEVSTRFLEPNLGGTGLVERSFTQRTTYDALGRVATTQDATGGVVENMYSAHGFLRRVRDAGQPSLVFWELLETDVRGQTTLDRRHGKVELTQKREYNEVTGRLARIATGRLSNGEIVNPVQKLAYTFDAQGNLLSRRDERSSSAAEHVTETFVYDSLNRLTLARAATGVAPMPNQGFETMSLAYDKLGNICSKNGVGYTYAGRSGCGLNGVGGSGGTGSASPHAVTARGSLGYQYDAAGNMTTTTGGPHGTRTVRFDGAGNADRLAISTQSTSFWYAGGGRYLRLDESSDTPVKLTRYLGGVEWILRSGGGVEERRRSIGGFLLLTETESGPQQPPTRKYRYLLTDHLGSTDTLVDENGAVVERMSFDAHGSRRAAASGTGMWASLLPAVAPTEINPQVNAETTRGFTGHEHVDRMGLIHMNGRLYDPLLGRMLSPDPIVQEPYNAQNLNRYSYVLNNPLSYTYPSGLSFVKKYWRQIVAAAVSVFFGPAAAAAWGAWGAAAVGFVSGTIATGSWEGGLWGAFSGAVFFGIGSYFDKVAAGNASAVEAVRNAGFPDYALRTVPGTGLTSAQFAGQVLSHAVAGGVISSLQGGRFGHGFVSAGISKAATPATSTTQGDFARATVHALIGGTASAASGGKFANGAASAVLAFVFNDLSHGFWEDAWLGTRIHSEILYHYQGLRLNARRGLVGSMSWPADGAVDLAVGNEIWEIKPESYASGHRYDQARTQLRGYVSAANRGGDVYYAGSSLTLGLANGASVTKFISFLGKQWEVTWYYDRGIEQRTGLIFYHKRQIQSQPVQIPAPIPLPVPGRRMLPRQAFGGAG